MNFCYKDTPIIDIYLLCKSYAWIWDNRNEYFLGINGAYEHAMSVVGVFFILITIAVAYIIRRKRSERGKDKLILRTFVDAFYNFVYV